MRRYSRFLAVAAMVASAITANAVEVINFDDIALGGATRDNFPNLGIQNSYHGYQWLSPTSSQHWAVVNNADSQFSSVGAFSGTQAGWNWNGSLTMDIVFDVPKFVQGAYFNVFDAGQTWGADGVYFEGYDASNTLVGTSSTLTLDDVNQSPAWQWLSFNQGNVKTLRINAIENEYGSSSWWTMDDLTLNPVPEPFTLFLAGAGLAAAVSRRNRKRGSNA